MRWVYRQMRYERNLDLWVASCRDYFFGSPLFFWKWSKSKYKCNIVREKPKKTKKTTKTKIIERGFWCWALGVAEGGGKTSFNYLLVFLVDGVGTKKITKVYRNKYWINETNLGSILCLFIFGKVRD